MPQPVNMPRIEVNISVSVGNTSMRVFTDKDGQIQIVSDNRLAFGDPNKEVFVRQRVDEANLIESLEHLTAMVRYAIGHDRFAVNQD